MRYNFGRPATTRFFTAMLAVLFCVSLMAAGCRTTSTEKTEKYSTAAGEEQTTVVKEKSFFKSDSGSLLGTTFRLIGKVVALPFELVGFIFDKII